MYRPISKKMEKLVGEFETYVRGYAKMKTLADYDRSLYFVLSHWPKLKHPGDLFGRDLIAMVDECLAKGYKLQTLGTHIKVLQTFYKYLTDVQNFDILNPAPKALAYVSSLQRLRRAEQPPAGESLALPRLHV